MKTRIILLLSAAVTFISCTATDTKTTGVNDPVDYVNVLVGTQSEHSFSTGNTYPAIARPWGSHFWTPQTGKNTWQYVYTHQKIRGFKMTHQPSPWIGDYGQFSLMPVTTGECFSPDERASWFTHKAETATPYFYSVYLAEHDTFVEMTPTEHAALFRMTYPERDLSYLVLDAMKNGEITSVTDHTIEGYSVKSDGETAGKYTLWFIVESDTPFAMNKTVKSDEESGIITGFPTAKGQQVNLKVAASFISPEQARFNLNEVSGKTFDTVKKEGREVWNTYLGRIEVKDDDIDNLRTFYSCLYRCLLFPRDLSETTPEGKTIHRSPYDYEIHDGHIFTDTGFWDTFRSLFALVDLVYPEKAAQMQEGLVNTYLESGFLPEWASPGHRRCMVGNNSASVVAEAYLKGIRGYDIETLWEALVHGAHNVHPTVTSTGRIGWEYYDSLGYVPCDVNIRESAARTLEYAYNDWCIWSLGKALGKSGEELAPYAKAAMNYKNLYRADKSLMSGRCSDGTFPEEFSEFKWGGDFTEGNSLHYTWSVFHDPAGLAELMGGRDKFAAGLDRIFELPPIFDESYYGAVIHEIREMQVMNMGNYAHGNQPVQHVLYLYDWCGQPWKAQQRIREVMDKFYTPAPDGYCGDEDNGQTSAWYVFSALGFYPACPASAQYAIGTPLFRRATVHLPSGKDIDIIAEGNSASNFYISDIKVNGLPWTANYFTHEQLTAGAVIKATMSGTPDTTRGTAPEDAPYSFSTAD